MKRFLLVVSLMVMVLSCGRNGRLIPRDDMAQIYAEMLLADQWIQEHKEYRRKADTTLFYEPIFEKYGFNTLDYLYSVEHYMDDPVRYSRILKKTSSILGARVKKIERYQKAMAERDAILPTFPWDSVDVIDFAAVPDTMGMWEMIDSVNDLLKFSIIVR